MNKHGIKTRFPFVWVIGIAVVFALLFFFNYDFGSTAYRSDNSYQYQITALQIDALVKEDNSIEISETYDVSFYMSSHGIYRTLYRYQEIEFEEDGKLRKERYEISLSDIDCSETFTIHDETNGYLIQIGDPYAYADEQETYTLSYTIHLGDDKISSFDQLYYNFVGTEWDTTISNISLNVNFEKPVEDREIFVYIGTGGEDIVESAQISNNNFSFVYDGTLQPYCGLTVRTLLDQGYFNAPADIPVASIVLLAVTLLLFAIGLVIFFTQNNKRRIIPVVEFSAPEGITPPDAGYIIDRTIDRGEVSALIVYWASRGYINIKQTDGRNILEKVKDADSGMKGYEKSIFQAMFPADKKEFDLDSEDMNVAREINTTKAPIIAENEKYFSKKIATWKNVFVILFAVMFGLVTYFASRETLFFEIGILDSVLIGLGVFFASKLILKAHICHLTMRKFSYFCAMIIGFAIFLGAYVTIAYFTFDVHDDPLLISIILPLVLFALLVLALLFNDRVEGENKEVGRLMGLRQFILVAEKDRIERLAKENPMAFYEVLPYAYVLGISGEWIDKFKDIEIPTPTWYIGAENILQVYIGLRLLGSIGAFNATLTKLLGTAFGKILTAAKVIGTIGTIGGGGGRSGGGLGGGGGGRW